MSVPRSCEPQERVYVKVQICEHSFAPDGGYCVYNSLNFFSAGGKIEFINIILSKAFTE